MEMNNDFMIRQIIIWLKFLNNNQLMIMTKHVNISLYVRSEMT